MKKSHRYREEHYSMPPREAAHYIVKPFANLIGPNDEDL